MSTGRPAPAGRSRRSDGERVVIAVSGVDGSGKSTLVGTVEAGLRQRGLPVTVVWARPGMDLRGLDVVARLVKRMVGASSQPAVRTVAEGGHGSVHHRRGAVGWAWAMLIAISFVVSVRRQHHRSCGFVLYDRHLLDALASIDVLYGGVDLRVQKALFGIALPRADVLVYLDVPAEVAARRKPEDPIATVPSLNRQLAHYRNQLGARDDVVVLDANRPSDELAATVLELAVAVPRSAGTSRRMPPWKRRGAAGGPTQSVL